MDENSKKKLLLILSCLAMMTFIFFAFIYKKKNKSDTDDFINPARLDHNPSKTEVYAQKRKRKHQEFNFDRRVNSLENFLDHQITKDPFADSSSLLKSDSLKFQTKEKPVIRERVYHQIKPSEKKKNSFSTIKTIDSTKTKSNLPIEISPRKTGFASGGGDDIEINQNKSTVTSIKVLSVVQENAQVKSGSDLKLRVLSSFKVNGIEVAENTFVIGKVLLSDDHIYINVNTISINDKLLTVNLSAYDLNGTKGIYVEGGLDKEIKSDVLGETVDQIQQRVNIPILRTLPFSIAKKKIAEPEVLITAGLKLYLINQ